MFGIRRLDLYHVDFNKQCPTIPKQVCCVYVCVYVHDYRLFTFMPVGQRSAWRWLLDASTTAVVKPTNAGVVEPASTVAAVASIMEPTSTVAAATVDAPLPVSYTHLTLPTILRV